ncbi:MAG: twitch domain-containing radical SAM protein [Candidatus Caldatribacteriota bacterium]
MKDKFICPIPWISLSLGAQNSPRLCCHQDIKSSYPAMESRELIELKHNTSYRDQMSRGEIPEECQHCLSLERNNCNSPRLDYLKRFSFDPHSQITPLKYLDITIDNECNLECIMCSPIYSHKLSRVFEGIFQMPPTSKWSSNLDIEEVIRETPELEQVTITGGEPLISSKSRSFIQKLTSHPNINNITLRIFTNFTLFDPVFMEELKQFKSIELILSIDSVKENYELMRFPSKWKTIINNVEKLKNYQHPHLDVHLHSVLTAVNWTSIGDLIKFYDKNLSGYNIIPVFVEIDSPLLHPRVLPKEQYQEGVNSIIHALESLAPRNEIHIQQIEDFKKLLVKIENQNYQDHYIDFQVYLKKIISYRNKLKNGPQE